MKKSILILVSIIMIGIFAGCTVGSGTSVKMSEDNNSHRMSATYSKFDGYKKTTVTVQNDEEIQVNVDVVTNKGNIDLKITHEDGTVAYQGDDMSTTSFNVMLDKNGEYTIRIDTDNHSGSYDINW